VFFAYAHLHLSSTSTTTYIRSTTWLAIALALWGIYSGSVPGIVGAHLCDCSPQSQQAKWLSCRFSARMIGNACGPLTAIVIFLFLGNDWTSGACAIVITAVQVLSFGASLMLCFVTGSGAGDNYDSLWKERRSRRGDIRIIRAQRPPGLQSPLRALA